MLNSALLAITTLACSLTRNTQASALLCFALLYALPWLASDLLLVYYYLKLWKLASCTRNLFSDSDVRILR